MGSRGRKSAVEQATLQIVSPPPERTEAGRRPRAPAHLPEPMRQWWAGVMQDYDLEPHHVHLLTSAAEAWHRMNQAREALAQHGLTYLDDRGAPKARPEVAIERDSRIAFARLIRELDLDCEPPPERSRPPALRSNRRV